MNIRRGSLVLFLSLSVGGCVHEVTTPCTAQEFFVAIEQRLSREGELIWEPMLSMDEQAFLDQGWMRPTLKFVESTESLRPSLLEGRPIDVVFIDPKLLGIAPLSEGKSYRFEIRPLEPGAKFENGQSSATPAAPRANYAEPWRLMKTAYRYKGCIELLECGEGSQWICIAKEEKLITRHSYGWRQ
ncbi:MAG: hypothetical protein RL095_2711 [Verrucomicrobiota bacterium]|jgi:hypothetical protein